MAIDPKGPIPYMQPVPGGVLTHVSGVGGYPVLGGTEPRVSI